MNAEVSAPILDDHAMTDEANQALEVVPITVPCAPDDIKSAAIINSVAGLQPAPNVIIENRK